MAEKLKVFSLNFNIMAIIILGIWIAKLYNHKCTIGMWNNYVQKSYIFTNENILCKPSNHLDVSHVVYHFGDVYY